MLEFTERNHRAQAGFSLVEAMVATIIAVFAVTGLAFSFSAGRGMIDRYAMARDALAAAEQRMERLSMLGLKDPLNPELEGLPPPGKLHQAAYPRPLNGYPVGKEQWTVTWINDPVDPSAMDYKRVTVDIIWKSGSLQDTIRLSRIILGS